MQEGWFGRVGDIIPTGEGKEKIDWVSARKWHLYYVSPKGGMSLL